MRTIKVLAILGLAVALVAVPAMAQRQIKLTPPADANDILIVAEVGWVIQEARWTKDGTVIGDPIKDLANRPVNSSLDVGFRNRFGTVKIDDQEIKLTPPRDANDILIVAKAKVRIKEAWWTRDGQRISEIKELKGLELLSIHGLTKEAVAEVTITVVPTLTEWGLIALAVLLAGGMGYMIYRRRPALRPAAP